MSQQVPNQPTLPLTDWAKRYGPHPTDPKRFPEIYDLPAHKSCFTPVKHSHLKMTKDELFTNWSVETYQRDQLSGFTTRELFDMDVITDRVVSTNTLKAAIHPILARSKWEVVPLEATRKLVPYRGDAFNNGYWVASNANIWPKLEPVLQIVSLMLEMLHELPWFETLMNGELKDVDAKRFSTAKFSKAKIRESRLLFKNHTAPPGGWHDPRAWRSKENKEKEEDMMKIIQSEGLRLGFALSEQDPETGQKDNSRWMALTHWRSRPPRVVGISIWLSTQGCERLMRDDLTTEERLREQVHVAMALFHELMHAYYRVRYGHTGRVWRPSYSSRGNDTEGYIEEEQLREVGHSGENALLGGIIEAWPQKLNIYHGLVTWPGSQDYYGPELIEPAISDTVIQMPVTITWCENLFSQNYWDQFVTRFGLRTLRPPETALMAISDRPGEDVDDGYDFTSIDPMMKTDQTISQNDQTISNFQASLCVNLQNATPQERQVHTVAMSKEHLVQHTRLKIRRQDKVEFVLIDEGLKLITDVDAFAQRITELIDIHEGIFAVLRKMQDAGDNFLEDALNDMEYFNEDLLSYLRKYEPDALFREQASTLYQRVEKTQQKVAELKATSKIPGDELVGQYTVIEDWQDGIWTYSDQAFKNGDYDRASRLSASLISSLVCLPRHKANARLLQGVIPSNSVDERVEHLQIALEIRELMEPADDTPAIHANMMENIRFYLDAAQEQQRKITQDRYPMDVDGTGGDPMDVDTTITQTFICEKNRKHGREDDEGDNRNPKRGR